MRDLITWIRVTRLYWHRGWPIKNAAVYAFELVFSGQHEISESARRRRAQPDAATVRPAGSSG